MKTKNNVQKAILKSVAVVTSLVLISLTVNGQVYWKSLFDNYNFNEIELALLENTTDNVPVNAGANVYASILEQETEEALVIESWMIDENYFTTSVSIGEAVEIPLDVEDWMINESLFNANSIYLELETEKTLELENWMTDENYFESSVLQVIEETEAKLEIENWMLNESLFESANEAELPLKLEAWMTSEEIW